MCFLGNNLAALDDTRPDFSIEQKTVFAKKSLELFEQFCNTLKSLYNPLGKDILEPHKLCDISHLNKIDYLLDEMPASIKKCQALYIQQQHDLETMLADDLFSKPEDRALFLQGLEENDNASRWVTQHCEIHKSLVEKLGQLIKFLINNQSHYQIQNKQLVFDSMDRIKKVSGLFEEISNLKQKEIEHLNLLPRA
jgi:hypothetical protein